MEEIFQQVNPGKQAYVASAFSTIVVGVVISLILAKLLKGRMPDVKQLPFYLVGIHLIIYAIMLAAFREDGVAVNLVRGSITLLSLTPSLLLAAGARRSGQLIKKEAEQSPPENASAETAPSIREGIIRGIWAFVSFGVFYIFFNVLFDISLKGFSKLLS